MAVRVRRAEYNSDRNISSFELPLSPDATVWTLDSTMWTTTVDRPWTERTGSLRRCRHDHLEMHRNLRAERVGHRDRWGTTYNFRFSCDRGPRVDTATLGVQAAG